MRSTNRLSSAVAVATFAGALMALGSMQAEAQDAKAPVRLGKVHFKVECNAAAQKEFDLAMAYYHSFAWELYKAPLDRALAADPTCGMAHWLNALAKLDNPFVWPTNIPAKVLDEAQAALDAARATGLKSQRERDYVAALQTFFTDRDKLNHRTRAKALEDAMAQVAARYADDTEATILHALILSVNFDPTDKKYTNQLKAAQILEPIMMAQPEHPGAAHYLIHSYDYPPIAKQGLEAARRYSRIAPDAAHALHMPSHIFTRVGDWGSSVEANRVSAEYAKASLPNRLHAYDYMVYAHLQQGQDKAAAEVIARMREAPTTSDAFAAAYGFAAMPARYALERGAWQEAASLPLYPAATTYGWQKMPHAEAVNAYARGIGAALSGNPAAATVETKRLHALRDAAQASKLNYWVEQIDIQAEVVRALTAVAEGRKDEGMAILRKAADREDATEKHAVTPGPLLPARELLANLMLSSGAAADALAEYEKVMKTEPNRYRTLAGAAEAARKANDAVKARLYSAKLIEIAAKADSPRTEIADAKRYLGS